MSTRAERAIRYFRTPPPPLLRFGKASAHSTPLQKVERGNFPRGRGASSIRERAIKARTIIQFSRLQNFAAVQALNVLSVIVLGDYAGAHMLAGRVGHFDLIRILARL